MKLFFRYIFVKNKFVIIYFLDTLNHRFSFITHSGKKCCPVFGSQAREAQAQRKFQAIERGFVHQIKIYLQQTLLMKGELNFFIKYDQGSIHRLEEFFEKEFVRFSCSY